MGDLFPPEQAESVSIGGVDVSFRMSGRETDGAYAVLEFRLDPGRLIPPHAHRREHEVSYVLEGEIGDLHPLDSAPLLQPQPMQRPRQPLYWLREPRQPGG
jgi:hypothetical protein